MQPKKTIESPDMFRSRLDQILNKRHPLYHLAHQIDWSHLEKKFRTTYVDEVGRPGNPIRLMVGLHYLKHAFNESDESVMDRFLENPYWQYFCGFDYFQHELPIDSSSLTRFRKRVGVSGTKSLFKELLNTAKRSGHLSKRHLEKVNVDTTVQEKAIAFPTDARLYFKMREHLVRAAHSRGFHLRQSYKRLAKKALARQGRYSHARQMKRSKKMTKRLKTMLGCVYRDILRKAGNPDGELQDLLNLADRLLKQQKHDKNKLYSIHEPEVECISKGKIHKRYEFGNKVSFVTTSRDNWIVGIQSFHGNPYDGHTLSESIDQVKQLTGWQPKEAYADLGYRGYGYQGETKVNIVNYRTINQQTRSVRKWFKRRNAIEPIIGHVKTDNRMSKNYLKGTDGDHINAFLSGCGFTMRKLIVVFFLPYFLWQFICEKISLFRKYQKVNAVIIYQ